LNFNLNGLKTDFAINACIMSRQSRWYKVQGTRKKMTKTKKNQNHGI